MRLAQHAPDAVAGGDRDDHDPGDPQDQQRTSCHDHPGADGGAEQKTTICSSVLALKLVPSNQR